MSAVAASPVGRWAQAAWPVAATLALGLAGALYLTFYPPPMHGGSAGLPL